MNRMIDFFDVKCKEKVFEDQIKEVIRSLANLQVDLTRIGEPEIDSKEEILESLVDCLITFKYLQSYMNIHESELILELNSRISR